MFLQTLFNLDTEKVQVIRELFFYFYAFNGKYLLMIEKLLNLSTYLFSILLEVSERVLYIRGYQDIKFRAKKHFLQILVYRTKNDRLWALLTRPPNETKILEVLIYIHVNDINP